MARKNTMRTVSLRNILAHKLRLALTLLAVVLGTAFIAGSFMFTNTLSDTFDEAVSSTYDDVDAAVNGEGFDGKTIEMLEKDPHVERVNLKSNQTVVVANSDAVAFQTGGGTSSLVPYYPADKVVGQAYEVTEGAEPQGKGEVVVTSDAAEKYGIAVGDKLLVVHPDHRDEVKVAGLVTPEGKGGATGSSLTLMMAEDAFTEVYGNASTLAVAASEGTTADQLVEHINAEYGEGGPQDLGMSAESGAKLAEEATETMASALKFINYFLIAFGLIALLVGTFIIANTFSMIVAQRTKEFALLRALGASRGQVTRSVIFESVIVGLIGSAVGVVAGMGLVAIIKAVMNAQGMEMGSSLGLSVSAIIVPIILGTIVTVVSAWAPAQRAGAVQPVEAMRSSEASTSQPLTVRTWIGVPLILMGVALAAWGMASDAGTGARASLIGGAALAIIVGFFLASPAISLFIVPPLGRVVGAPCGAVGRLAATNSKRNPRRTAATAFALMLGVALVTAIGMLGATMKSSVSDTVESNITADYLLSGPQSGNFPTPAETGQRAADTPGVEEVISLSVAPVTVDGQASLNYGPQYTQSMMLDGKPADMITFEMAEGTADFEGDGFIASTDFAQQNGWKVGESYPLAEADPAAAAAGTPAKEIGQVELKGTFDKSQIVQNMVVVSEAVPAAARTVNVVGVRGEDQSPEALETLRSDLEESVKDLVVVQVMSGEDYAGQAATMIDQMLSILYGLLALAVIIAILGIVNTLTLGVIERRQEIGMLRAVGSQRGQIRTMIILEAVQIAFYGALSGVVIGLGLGWAFLKVLASQGLDAMTIPWGMIALMLVGSGLVGVIAALWPAGRAAKTPPLDAIAE